MADLIFKVSPNVVLGSYTLSRLAQYVKPWGSKFMIILDPVLKDVQIYCEDPHDATIIMDFLVRGQ